MKVWLDDVRPAPDGWVHVRSYLEFVDFMSCEHCLGSKGADNIEEMSLDHDLGANCERCYGVADDDSKTVVQSCGGPDSINTPGEGGKCKHMCLCHKTGYDCIVWMVDNDRLPPVRPVVHSMNPVGRARMQQLLKFEYDD